MREGFTEWNATNKIVLTISRERDNREVATKFAVGLLSFIRDCEISGATIRETIGQWQGQIECGCQIEFVGDTHAEVFRSAQIVADAAIENGCSAVQWERYSSEFYSCREYRG